MTARRFARLSGWFMLIVGVLSLFMVGSPHDLPDMRIEASYGRFLGYLPLNLTSKILLICFGLSGIVIAKKFTEEDPSIDFSRVLFYTMGTIATCSWSRDTNTLFGYMPVNSGAGIFFWILAILGFIYGYVTLRAQLHDSEPEAHAV